MLTELQRQQRINYIGGSDCSSIMGVNPYQTKIQLYLQKVGYEEAEDISHKPWIKAGNYLEPVIRKWFADETGLIVEEEPETLFHPEFAWMAANIDGWIMLPGGKRALLEIKTARTDRGWGAQGDRTTMPDMYLCQVAHYRIVTGVEKVYIAVLIGGSDFRIYEYKENKFLEDKIKAKEKLFWNAHVLKQIPPEPTTAEEVITLYGTDKNVITGTMIADDVMHELVNRYYSLTQIVDGHSSSLKQLKDEICVLMGPKDTVLDNFGTKLVTFRARKGAETLDKEKLLKDHPEIVAKYVKIGKPSRTFKVEL